MIDEFTQYVRGVDFDPSELWIAVTPLFTVPGKKRSQLGLLCDSVGIPSQVQRWF